MKQHGLTLTWRQIELARWAVSSSLEAERDPFGDNEMLQPEPSEKELEELESILATVSTGIAEDKR